MNPPFGTKNNEGVDVKLLSAAINVPKSINYHFLGMQWQGLFPAQRFNM